MLRIFKKKQNPKLRKELIHILQENLKYVESSGDSDWSEMSSAEISNQLKKSISKIAQGKRPRKFWLNYLFSPAGPLQETAIANGWTDQYMELSSQFDKIIKELG